MPFVDVFNGDADGICALHQLRLLTPRPEAKLVTGVKRDINLLARLPDIQGNRVTVLDISLDKNRSDLIRLLDQRNTVFYADHHHAGEIPAHPQLEVHIDPDPLVCTSIIINRLVGGKFSAWAAVGAFGDNLDESALRLLEPLSLSQKEIQHLRETGILLNYNGYGASEADLLYHPADLYRELAPYTDPLEFHRHAPALARLREGYRQDMDRARNITPLAENECSRVYELPATAWARRVSGVFSNLLAREQPEKAHALLTGNKDGTVRISVRAPLARREGADLLCRQFPTGGGRSAAAGINALPPELKDSFLSTFSSHFRN